MERYCDLDVHKDSVFMCIIDKFGFKKEHKFSTLTCDLPLLRESVLMKGLVCGSYVPSQAIQSLRQYERYYSRLNKKIVGGELFIDMQLQRCNIRFSNYISDIGSQAMRKVLKSIIAGKTTSFELLACAHTRTKNKHGVAVIQESLNGVFEQVDIDMLKLLVEEPEMHEKQQQECVINMVRICNKSYEDPISLLVTIPGIKQQSAMTMTGRIGQRTFRF